MKPAALLENRDDEGAKRRQILNGARAVFFDQGFDGASMGEIARVAGVSKGTLYVYFTDKSHLFEEIVEQEILSQSGSLDFSGEGDVATMLGSFGRAYLAVLCRPGGGSSVRTVMAIAERMPDVGSRFYHNVLAVTAGQLADHLRPRVEAGDLVIDDCDLAATQFMQLCQATIFQPFLFQAASAPEPEHVNRVVDSAVRMFLSLYQRR